jgi:hypothetical protein
VEVRVSIGRRLGVCECSYECRCETPVDVWLALTGAERVPCAKGDCTLAEA